MEFVNFSIPRFKQLPKVPLYKDQVIIYLEDLAKSLNIESNEKLLTPTMLNSYVKQRVIPAPKDKKYTEEHLAYLIVVGVLKQVFSLQEICELKKIPGITKFGRAWAIPENAVKPADQRIKSGKYIKN